MGFSYVNARRKYAFFHRVFLGEIIKALECMYLAYSLALLYASFVLLPSGKLYGGDTSV